MADKPTYQELEQRVKELEKETIKRTHAEESLRDSEKRSRAWLEHSPVCTKIVDRDFNLQFMSSAGIEDLKIDDITKCIFRSIPAGDSGRSRPPIPIDSGHRFRGKPATHSGRFRPP